MSIGITGKNPLLLWRLLLLTVMVASSGCSMGVVDEIYLNELKKALEEECLIKQPKCPKPPEPVACPEPISCPVPVPCPKCTPLPIPEPEKPVERPTGPVKVVKCQDFKDGGWNALWKPHSESTGGPVILLPEKDGVTLDLEPLFYDRNGGAVTCGGDCTTKRSNKHNANQDGTPRAHWWIKNSAGWWKQHAPLTIKWFRGAELIECRTVADPTKRVD